MQSQHTSQSNTPDEAVSEKVVDVLQQRRRALLRGLGKGSTVAGLASIQSLASAQSMTERLCTVSGVQSNVGSGRTGGTTAKCSGYTQSSFATLSNWPGYVAGNGGSPGTASYAVNGVTYDEKTRFNTIFGAGASATNPRMVDVFSTGTPSEKIWAAALLSAAKKELDNLGPTAVGTQGYFPYTPKEVVDLFSSAGPVVNKSSAETFFAQYLVLP